MRARVASQFMIIEVEDSALPSRPRRSRASARRISGPAQAVLAIAAGRTASTALPTALVVGTILSAANEGGAVLSGHLRAATLVRIGVNYLTPYVVASIGYLGAMRRQQGSDGAAKL